MSSITVASLIQAVPFAIVAILAGVTLARQRELRTFFLVAIFTSITGGLLLTNLALFIADQSRIFYPNLVRVGDALVLLSVFLLFLFAQSFRQASRLLVLLVGLHLTFALASILYGRYESISTPYGTTIFRSSPESLAELSFLALWVIYSGLIFLQRSTMLSGLMKGRLRLIVAACVLSVVASGLQTTSFLASDAGPFVTLLGTSLGLACGICCYLGLATPRWLRNQLMSSQLDLLALLSRSLVTGVRLENLLQGLVKDAVDLLGVNSGVIGLWVQKRNEMVIEATAGLSTIEIGTRISPKESPVITKILNKLPVVLTDARSEKKLSRNERGRDAGSLVAVPITLKDQLIGGLVVFFDSGPLLTRDDMEFLALFANRAAIAIHDASVYMESEKRALELKTRAEELSALNELALEISRSLDLDQVLTDGIRLAAKILRLDAGGVFLLDENADRLLLATQWNIPQRLLDDLTVVGIKNSLVGTVAITGQQLIIGNLEEDERSKGILLANDFHAFACIPLMVKGSTLGVLALAGKNPHVFTESDEQLLNSIASQISVAVENAQLYQSVDTKLQEKLAELTANKATLESTIQSVTHGLLIYDLDNRLVFANKAVHRFFGQEEGSLTGLTAAEITSRVRHCYSDPTQADRIAGVVIAQSSKPSQNLLELNHPQHVFIERTATPVVSDSGEFLGQVVVYHDVTEEKEAQRMKDEFLATISHELRTPLTAILGYTDLLLRKVHGDLTPAQENFEISVKNNALRLLSLINAVLDLSRLGAGMIAISSRPTAFMPVLERALGRIAMLATAKGLSIETDIPEDLPMIHADEDKLQQILENLVSNAVKFTENGGRIWIDARTSDEHQYDETRLEGLPLSIVVSVRDTGVGIPPDHLYKIWDAFHQADSSSTRRFGGMGLGLPITKNLVELHGGRIWAESEGVSGNGSTFSFTIPLAVLEPDDIIELASLRAKAPTIQVAQREGPENP